MGLVGLVVLILEFGLPILLWLGSFTVPPTQAETVHSDFDEPFRESRIRLVLKSFDPNAKTVFASGTIDIYDPEYWELWPSRDNIAFSVNSEDLSYDSQFIDQNDNLAYTTDFALTLQGDPTRYPFDSYSGAIDLGVLPPDGYLYTNENGGISSPRLLPSTFEIKRLISGYEVAFDEDSASVNSFQISLKRTPADKVLFVVAAALYLGLIGTAIIAVLTNFGSEHPLIPIVTIAGLGLSLPGLRDLLVPSDINVRTAVDIYMVLPFLIGATFVLIIGAIRNAPRFFTKYD